MGALSDCVIPNKEEATADLRSVPRARSCYWSVQEVPRVQSVVLWEILPEERLEITQKCVW